MGLIDQMDRLAASAGNLRAGVEAVDQLTQKVLISNGATGSGGGGSRSMIALAARLDGIGKSLDRSTEALTNIGQRIGSTTRNSV